ncbi:MAG: MTH895/ArsE family thioredoxin-like protein [Planctomycetota bacterium]
MKIEVLGTGCAKCDSMETAVRQVADRLGIDSTLEHVKDIRRFAAYGVMITPALFIDVWKDPAAKTPYNIRLIPTQVLFDAKRNEVWRHEGFISKEDLKSAFAGKAGVE